MLRSAIWRDLRWRVLAALPLVVTPATLVAFSYVVEARRNPPGPAGRGLAAYVDAAWFRAPGASAIFIVAAVLVGTLPTLLRPRADLRFLLALPVTRSRWVAAHFGMSLAALAGLVVLTDLIFVAAAVAGHVPLAPGPLLARSLALLAGASAWVGVALGVASLVRHSALAVVLLLAGIAVLPNEHFRLDLPVRASPPPPPPWDAWLLVDPIAWSTGPPAASLATAAGLGLAGFLLAVERVRRFEP